MAGALLRSGSVKDFYPLGAVGNPVYSAASQLRAAMRRQLGQPVADLFAIPKQDEQGDTIDWYAPVEGNVIPWSAATAEERAHAKTTLLTAREQLAGRSQALQAVNDSEQQVFGKLLALAMRIPSDEHIYLVNGHPVLTFWGFTERDAPPDRDVISGLQVGAPLAAATGATTLTGPAVLAQSPERSRRRFWWWLLPLLLLLLLLLLALFGLRGCESDAFPPWVLEWFGQDPIQTAEPVQAEECWQILERIENRAERDKGQLLQDKKVLIECQQLLQANTEWIKRYKKFIELEPIDGGGGPGPIDQGVVEKSDDLPVPGPDLGPDQSDTPPPDTTPPDTMPLDTMPPDATPPDTTLPDELPPPVEKTNDDVPSPTDVPKPVDQTGETPVPPDDDSSPPVPPGSKLVIPPEASEKGSTEFLDGQWQSTSNLHDTSTGKPVQLQYEFKNGQGTATLLRKDADGREMACKAPVRAVMKDGRLIIDEQDKLRCPDGRNFNHPHVECVTDPSQKAKCRGTNPDGSPPFDIDMEKS